MKITNPTNQEISMQYKGVVHTIPANGSISGLAQDVATYWQTMIHNFIVVEADGSEEEIVEAARDIPAEVVEEVVAPVEEVVVEVVPEKPISKSKK